jgi:hypothetical protein
LEVHLVMGTLVVLEILVQDMLVVVAVALVE